MPGNNTVYTLQMISLIVGVVAVIVAILLFVFLVVIKKKFKKATMHVIETPYALDSEDRPYLKSVTYSAETNSIAIRRQDGVNKMHIYLKTTAGDKTTADLYLLNFTEGEVVDIDLPSGTSEYSIIIDRVDGKNIKNPAKGGGEVAGALVASLVTAILVGIACGAYAFASSYFIPVATPSYVIVYIVGFVVPIVVLIAIGVGLTALMNAIIHKGGK